MKPIHWLAAIALLVMGACARPAANSKPARFGSLAVTERGGAAATMATTVVGGEHQSKSTISDGTTGAMLNVVTEDAAHLDSVRGITPLAVRRDADTTLVGTDGDNAPLQVNAAGSLKVAITAGAGSGGTSIADDAAFTTGTTSVTPIAATLDNTGPDSVDEGDAGAVRMSANRSLYVSLRDNAGNERGLNIDASGNIGLPAGASTETTLAALAAEIAALSFAEDSAHQSADMGISALCRIHASNGSSGTPNDYGTCNLMTTGELRTYGVLVRDDALSTLAVAEGEYTPQLTDSTGATWMRLASALPAGTNNIGDIDVLSSALPTGAATAALQVTHVDDLQFNAAALTVPMAAKFDDASVDGLDENDAGIVRQSANRNLYTTIRDAAGNERGANVGSDNALLVHVVPGSTTTILTAGNTSADVNSSVVPTAECKGMWFEAEWLNGAATATGTIEMWGGMSDPLTGTGIDITDRAVQFDEATSFAQGAVGYCVVPGGESGTWYANVTITSAETPTMCKWHMPSPLPYLMVHYDATTGGSASDLTIRAYCEPR